MSYISIIIPAFHLNSSDISEIQKQCSIQFNIPTDNFELLKINDNTNNINYGIKFIESCLCLSSLEDLIYERNCMQSLSEKTYESLQSMNKRLNELENQLCSFNNSSKDNNDKDLMNDNIKLKQLLVSQIEYSDNFRINTENTLNKIKDEFKSVVNELEKLRKKPENKSIYNDSTNADNVIKKYLSNCGGNSSLCLLNTNNQNNNWVYEGNTNNNGDTFINHSIGIDSNKVNVSKNIMGNK